MQHVVLLAGELDVQRRTRYAVVDRLPIRGRPIPGEVGLVQVVFISDVLASAVRMTAEEAAAYLKRTPKAFEKIVAKGEIPRHYLTERGILFSRKELDEWLMER
jgi:excisionase family DNA binding protein